MNNIYKIPLRNKNKEIIDYILVSEEDYEKVNKIKWHISLSKDGYKHVTGKINNRDIRLSHFIFGKPKDGYIIDHIDNNSLNHQKENLREITYSENSQNRNKTTKETTSKYIGVSYKKNINKWCAQYSCNNLGNFENELDAAKQYDKYILLKFGEKANTNNLIKFNEVKDLNISDLIQNKKKRELPDNIYKDNSFKNGKYFSKIIYNKIQYKSPYFDTIEEAIKELEILTKKINETKKNNEIKHNIQEITRDENNNAIIYLNKDKTKYTIVDDILWYNLCKYSWRLRENNYVVGKINNKDVRMHRYILNAPNNIYVDHIDNNPLNNKKENLRLATAQQNSFNKSKTNTNCTSKYKGVSYSKQNKKFMATLFYQSIKYNLGSYNNEIIAGLAYNIKAQELFGEFANLNEINLDTKTYEEYKKEIYSNWNKEKKSKFIGVGFKNNLYTSNININKKQIYLGGFKEEIQAALAYNLKKIELNNNNSEGLKLNQFDLDDETYEKYKKEIMEKWENKAKKSNINN